MKIYKIMLLCAVMCIMAGCYQEALQFAASIFGGEGETSTATEVATGISPYLPGGLGLALIAVTKMLHNAVRVKKALFDTTKAAIDNGSLASADSENAIKLALNTAQGAHDSSKLLKKAYDKYKNGGSISKIFNKVKAVAVNLFKKQ